MFDPGAMGRRTIDCWVWIDGRWWSGYLEHWQRDTDGWWGWCWAEWHQEARWYPARHLEPRSSATRPPPQLPPPPRPRRSTS